MKMIRFFLCMFLLSSVLSAANVHVVRAAIDIGMGGPKLRVAEIDLETNKIVRVLHTERYFVNFYEGMSKSDDKNLSTEVMAQGLEAFKKAMGVAHSFKADGVVALATASLRAASNGIEFATRIQDETDIQVHIVDQTLEAKLAFQAVLSNSNIDPENLVVWDIGGGSIQFIGTAADGSYLVDCGKEGVGAFNDYIIGTIQSRDIKECKTPNPMSAIDILCAEEYAQNLSCKVDQAIKNKLSHPTTQVVGAGSVFGYGIATMVGKNVFCLEDITTVVRGLAGKTDADFGGGEFAFCEGSNTILALGFMKGLGIQQMHIVNVNNADGAMIYAPFWKQP